jgi:hypothetical protein
MSGRHHDGPGGGPPDPTGTPAPASGRWEPVTGTVVEARDLDVEDGHADPVVVFVVEVHPEGRPPIRAEIRYDASNEYDLYADLCLHDAGDVTGFVVDTGSGEVRFDMSDPRNSTSARILARLEAEGTAPSADAGPEVGPTGPPWAVPATCPRCGAPVDQAVASRAVAPACDTCLAPLPVQPQPRA